MTAVAGPRIRTTAPAVLILLFLSGCTGPPASEEQTPEIGLGLAVPAHLPEPRPFQEPPGQLQVLEDFLRDDGRRILRDCGNEGGWTEVARMLDAKKYRSAIDVLLDHCSQPLASEDEWRAERAAREGNEAEVQEMLHAQAVNATQAVADALDAHAGPGTVVEAQLLKELASRHLWDLNTIDSALRMWRPYENGTERSLLQLRGAYLGLLGARGDSEAILAILEAYPWTQPACIAPDTESLVARIQAKLDEDLALAKDLAEPGDAEYVSRPYGLLLKSYIPAFEYYEEHEWWASLLALEVEVEMQIAYWHNLTAPAWPTEEEARFLLASFRNETRTIWTEGRLLPKISYLEDPAYAPYKIEWTDVYHGAPAFMGTMAMRWPYANLQCS